MIGRTYETFMIRGPVHCALLVFQILGTADVRQSVGVDVAVSSNA
jgi:hypothetical protein